MVSPAARSSAFLRPVNEYVATAHALRVPLVTLDQDQLSRAAAAVTARTP